MKIDKYTIYAQHVERAVELKAAYPSVKPIKIHVLNTNAWRSDWHKEFTTYPENLGQGDFAWGCRQYVQGNV